MRGRITDERLEWLVKSFDSNQGNHLTYPIPNTEWHDTVLDLADIRAELEGARKGWEVFQKAVNRKLKHATEEYVNEGEHQEYWGHEIHVLRTIACHASLLYKFLGDSK